MLKLPSGRPGDKRKTSMENKGQEKKLKKKDIRRIEQ
jgi:hypothetical protein